MGPSALARRRTSELETALILIRSTMTHSSSRPRSWICALRQWQVWRRAALVGLSVGILQAALNQGDYWVTHTVNGTILAKTIISPLLTFSVALASSAGTWVEKNFTSN
jgi:hypothetical protein